MASFMSPPESFPSAEAEISFWKDRCNHMEEQTRMARDELEEFQIGSRELEAELEAQLEQAETKCKEFRSLSNRLQMDNEHIQSKLEQCQREYTCRVCKNNLCSFLVF